MRRIIRGLLLCGGLLLAQSPAIFSSQQGAGTVQIKPQPVPTSTTVVAESDAWVIGVVVVNTTSVGLSFTLASREASPVAFLSSVVVAGNTTYVISVPYGYWLPKGFTVIASGSGLNYTAVWRQ